MTNEQNTDLKEKKILESLDECAKAFDEQTRNRERALVRVVVLSFIAALMVVGIVSHYLAQAYGPLAGALAVLLPMTVLEKKVTNLYLVKLYFRNEGQIKTFSDKQKLREFVTVHVPCKKC